uniref:hypothetical protein n=2 Tax=Yoonia sp. TaxID=2212373 RepID=UPI004048AEFC
MAGRPRLPQEVAKVTGAIAKNAGRFVERATPKVKSLGPPPKHFDEDQKEIWAEFNADFSWLGRTDRSLVGMACVLQAEINKGEAPIAAFAQLRLMLSSMGGTPVDRTKIKSPDDEDTDPSDEFLN